MEPIADLRPCDRCGYTHPRRMIALMGLWFARFAELPADGGYFYLCPRCYARLIEPHAEEIIHRLVEQHPFLHAHAVRHYRAEGPEDVPGRGPENPGAVPSPPPGRGPEPPGALPGPIPAA